jgi:hypothetical protein
VEPPRAEASLARAGRGQALLGVERQIANLVEAIADGLSVHPGTGRVI